MVQVSDLIQSYDKNWNMGDKNNSSNILCHELHHIPKNSYADERNSSNERLLAILYTSGSTGTPKGARILHSSAINRLKWQWTEFPYRKRDVCAFKVTYAEQYLISYLRFYIIKNQSLLE